MRGWRRSGACAVALAACQVFATAPPPTPAPDTPAPDTPAPQTNSPPVTTPSPPAATCTAASVDANCQTAGTVSGLCQCSACKAGYLPGDTDAGPNTRCIVDVKCTGRAFTSCDAAAHCRWIGGATGCVDKSQVVVRGSLGLGGVNYFTGFLLMSYPNCKLAPTCSTDAWESAVEDFLYGLLSSLPAAQRPARADVVLKHPADTTTCAQAPYNDPPGANCLDPVQDLGLSSGVGSKHYYQVTLADPTTSTQVKTLLQAAAGAAAGIQELNQYYRYVLNNKNVDVTVNTARSLFYADHEINLATPVACSTSATNPTARIEADGQLCTQDSSPTDSFGNTVSVTRTNLACVCNDAGPSSSSPRFRCTAGKCDLILSVGCNQVLASGNECVNGAAAQALPTGQGQYCKCTSSAASTVSCLAPGAGACAVGIAASTSSRCQCLSDSVTGAASHVYTFHTQLMTMDQARERCGGRLVKIETEAEATFVAREMFQRGIARAWIAGTKYGQYDWRFSDSEPMAFACSPCGSCPCKCASGEPNCPWRPGQPSSDPNLETCLTLTQALGETAAMQALGHAKIGDEPCNDPSHLRGAVCEDGYAATPVPVLLTAGSGRAGAAVGVAAAVGAVAWSLVQQ